MRSAPALTFIIRCYHQQVQEAWGQVIMQPQSYSAIQYSASISRCAGSYDEKGSCVHKYSVARRTSRRLACPPACARVNYRHRSKNFCRHSAKVQGCKAQTHARGGKTLQHPHLQILLSLLQFYRGASPLGGKYRPK